MQTDHKLRENHANDVFVQIFESGEMDCNFAVEHALPIGLAFFADHGGAERLGNNHAPLACEHTADRQGLSVQN